MSGSQGWQAVAPLPEKVLAGQGWQAVEPAAGAKVPGLQGKHSEVKATPGREETQVAGTGVRDARDPPFLQPPTCNADVPHQHRFRHLGPDGVGGGPPVQHVVPAA